MRAKRPRRTIVVFENERRPMFGDTHPMASAEQFHHSHLNWGERQNFSDSERSSSNPSCASQRAQLVVFVLFLESVH
jgi:hypothetical protein